MKAATFGVSAGLLFGLSASFAKTTIDQLSGGILDVLSHPEAYALVGIGLVAFGVQQLSLSTGQFAPAMAAVAVSNPAISVVLGVLLFEESLTRPAWHVLVARLALVAAFFGAYMITAANREREMPGRPGSRPRVEESEAPAVRAVAAALPSWSRRKPGSCGRCASPTG